MGGRLLTAELGTRGMLWTSWGVTGFGIRDRESPCLLEACLSASNEDRRGHDGREVDGKRMDRQRIYLCEG